MADDFRALCAELLADYELNRFRAELAAEARAALAEGAGVTDKAEIVLPSADVIEADFRCWWADRFGFAYFGAVPLVTCIEWTQLAIARYGTHPRPRPIPVAELRALLSPGYELGDGSMDGAQIVDCEWWHPEMGCDSLQFAVDNCRAIAQPRPIPVAERLPTAADCDAEGRCWFLSPRFLTWSLETPPVAQTRGIGRFFWLPFFAIPLPEESDA